MGVQIAVPRGEYITTYLVSFYCVILFFDTGSPIQLKLALNLQSYYLGLLPAGITDLYHFSFCILMRMPQVVELPAHGLIKCMLTRPFSKVPEYFESQRGRAHINHINQLISFSMFMERGRGWD